MFVYVLVPLLVLECIVAALLVLPMFNGAKLWMVDFLDRQAWAHQAAYLLLALFALIAVLFCAHLPKLIGGRSDISDALLGVEALIGQRDATLAGFALALLGMMYRFYSVMRSAYRIEKSHAALQKQAKSLSETTKTYLDQNAVLVHENEVLRKAAGARKRIIDQADDVVADSSSASDSDRTVTLVAERDAWQQKYVEQERRSRELERNLESLKKQAAAQSAEYLRLTSEKEGLQRQLEDFNLVFGDARKKQV